MARQNLTVQLDGDVITKVKVLAAKRGISVSGLVAAEIQKLVEEDERYEAASQRVRRALATAAPRGGRRWSRDELYDR